MNPYCSKLIVAELIHSSDFGRGGGGGDSPIGNLETHGTQVQLMLQYAKCFIQKFYGEDDK